jgi:hypothetical protein
LIIHLIIQTILLYPSGAVWTDDAAHVSRRNPSGADQIDAKHPTRNRQVEGSNPSSGSKTAGQDVCLLVLPLALLASLIIPHAGTWPREASRLTTALQTRVIAVRAVPQDLPRYEVP